MCVLALAFAGGVSAQPFGYAVNSDGFEVPEDEIDNLYQINLSTGEAIRIGPTGFLDVEGLSFSSSGVLMGADDESNSLLMVDIRSGNAEAVGGLPGNLRLPAAQVLDFGLSYTCDALYASSDNLRMLYQVNEQNGEAVEIGSTGVPLTGLASYQNVLYGIGAGEEAPALYRIDVNNGATTLVGFLGEAAAPYVDAGLDFDSDGRLWAITDRRNVNNTSNPSQILQIDPNTGLATAVAETLSGIEALAISSPRGCDISGGGGTAVAVPALNPITALALAMLLLVLGMATLKQRITA